MIIDDVQSGGFNKERPQEQINEDISNVFELANNRTLYGDNGYLFILR